ncbi:MAG: recombination-associated protein RdgC [Victivallaceae bacterium]|nr:recombination-associated protein RdgC [Victivallaceae bacterium]
MPFDRGAITMTIFELPAGLPEDYLARFSDKAAGTLDSVTEELQAGWVSGRCLLETTIDSTTSIAGDGCMVTLRKAVRRIPAGLLTAMLKREEIVWRKANEKDYTPGGVRRELRAEIIEKNIQKFPPSVSGTTMWIDPATGAIYVSAVSQNAIDEIIGAFVSTMEVEPLPFDHELLLRRNFDKSCAEFPAIELKKGVPAGSFIGRDFLTWLWFFHESGGVFHSDEIGDVEISLDGPLSFAGDDPECNGSAETVVKKGENPLRSAEAKAAFEVGKKLRKAKLLIARDTQMWSLNFDADRFNFSSLRLPEGEKLDFDSSMAERLENLDVFKRIVELAFNTFAKAMLGPDGAKEAAAVREWASHLEGV